MITAVGITPDGVLLRRSTTIRPLQRGIIAPALTRDEVVSFAQVQPVPSQGSIEIVIRDAMIKVGADVDARQLQMVLRAVRAR